MDYARQVIYRLGDFGMDAGVIVEHNSPTPPPWWDQLVKSSPIPVFWGCEFSSSRGHLLIITPSGGVDLPPVGSPMQEAVKRAVESGGVAIVAHPYSTMHRASPGDEILKLQGLTAVETINGALGLESNRSAQMAALALGLPGIGGSDAHSPYHVGRAWTVFQENVKTQIQLVALLKEGRYAACRGRGCQA